MADVASKSSRRVKKAATGVLLVAVASLGIGGFLHTKWGKPWLARLGGCPVASPEEVEQARNKIVAADKATRVASAHFALGFDLDTQKYADVQRWAASHQLSCEAGRGDSVLSCVEVPPSALPATDGAKSNIKKTRKDKKEKLQECEREKAGAI